MKKTAWLTRKVLVRGIAALATGGAVIALVYGIATGNVKAGIGADETVTKSEKRDKQGNITETTTTTTLQDAKTLWDWLSLLGVPFSLAILGYILQQLQQARAEQQAKAEKEIADQRAKAEKEIAELHQREEALQNYLDRLSELLIDKNLIATAVKLRSDTENQAKNNPSHPAFLEEKELLKAAIDVIRVRTLSILRRLGQDGDRKGDVIRFLIAAEVIGKLNLNLNCADLSDTDLLGATLIGVNLSFANLSRANLNRAKLISANLSDAELINADLNCANLSHANLSFANLDGATLIAANLSGAKLLCAKLSGAKLSGANLESVNLESANLSYTDLSGANIESVNLIDANLSGANLRSSAAALDMDTINWNKNQLSSAKLCKTILPKGCNLNPNRDCEALGISLDPPATESSN